MKNPGISETQRMRAMLIGAPVPPPEEHFYTTRGCRIEIRFDDKGDEYVTMSCARIRD